MKFNRRQIVRILSIAVIIVIASASMSWLFSPKEVPVQSVVISQIDEVVKTKVLVASLELVRGTILNTENSYWLEINEDAYTPFANNYISPDDPISEYIYNGKFIITDKVPVGEPLSKNKLLELGKGGALSSFLEKGKRAVSLELKHQNAGGGFVLPNDKVDIVYSRRDRGGGVPKSRVIIEQVKVIGVDQLFDVNGQQSFLARLITFELTPEEAKLLLSAKVEGDITLLLRAINDGNTDKKIREVLTLEEIEGIDKPKSVEVPKKAKVIRFGGR